MADAAVARPRVAGGPSGWLESACKLTLAVRAAVLLVTAASIGQEPARGVAIAAIVVVGVASILPLRYWDRVGPSLVRHPAYLAAELVLATIILLIVGVDSPFFYYTLGTALLGGLVYGWASAALFSAMLIGVYYWVLSVAPPQMAAGDFQVYIGNPALYPLIAAAGAAAGRLLDAQAEAEAALAEQERTIAAESERARLARDMHDSLAKTVSGIGFAALGLARHIERDPVGAAAEARQLAEDARQATREAREIIVGLRADAGQALPVEDALRAQARRYADSGGMSVEVAIDDVGGLHPVAARELEWILKEALANIERHAGAEHVSVRLRALAGRAVLTVTDDGAGFEVPDDLADLQGGRHFGVSGMRERAQLAGGDLSVESEPGDGCVISVWVPLDLPVEKALGPAPGPAEAAGADAPPRAVPGFTWR